MAMTSHEPDNLFCCGASWPWLPRQRCDRYIDMLGQFLRHRIHVSLRFRQFTRQILMGLHFAKREHSDGCGYNGVRHTDYLPYLTTPPSRLLSHGTFTKKKLTSSVWNREY
jgi:hypothetical protein